MKKIKVIVFALFASLALTSCTEMYLKKYESACEDGNAAKAAVYAGKLARKNLSAEQEQRVEEAALVLLQKEAGGINYLDMEE